MKNCLDPNRIKQLVSNDLSKQKKPFLISSIILVLVWYITSSYNIEGYFTSLIISGFILTAISLKEFHEPHLAYHYLMLPCSMQERFVSKWLISALFYPFALLLLYYVFQCVIHFMSFPHASTIFILQGIGVYIVLHSIIFLGAILFKRHALLKTILMIGIITSLFSWATGYLLIHAFPDYIELLIKNAWYFKPVFAIIFWVIVPAFFWTVTYFRMTECEMR